MTSIKAHFLALGILSATAGLSVPSAQAASYCSAVARCGYYTRDWYGRVYFVDTHTVTCEAWSSDAFGRCTQEWVFNSHVRCTGVDSFGNWVDTGYLRCW